VFLLKGEGVFSRIAMLFCLWFSSEEWHLGCIKQHQTGSHGASIHSLIAWPLMERPQGSPWTPHEPRSTPTSGGRLRRRHPHATRGREKSSAPQASYGIHSRLRPPGTRQNLPKLKARFQFTYFRRVTPSMCSHDPAWGNISEFLSHAGENRGRMPRKTHPR
jgi:hypothetical protein